MTDDATLERDLRATARGARSGAGTDETRGACAACGSTVDRPTPSMPRRRSSRVVAAAALVAAVLVVGAHREPTGRRPARRDARSDAAPCRT